MAFPIVFMAAKPMIVPPRRVKNADTTPNVISDCAKTVDKNAIAVAHFPNLVKVKAMCASSFFLFFRILKTPKIRR